jgi:hypothetical protein
MIGGTKTQKLEAYPCSTAVRNECESNNALPQLQEHLVILLSNVVTKNHSGITSFKSCQSHPKEVCYHLTYAYWSARSWLILTNHSCLSISKETHIYSNPHKSQGLGKYIAFPGSHPVHTAPSTALLWVGCYWPCRHPLWFRLGLHAVASRRVATQYCPGQIIPKDIQQFAQGSSVFPI